MLRIFVLLLTVFGCGFATGFVAKVGKETSEGVIGAVSSALSPASSTTPASGSLPVTVGGKVYSPGAITLSHGATLHDAIMKAGGATTFGSVRRVKVYRHGRLFVCDLGVPADRNTKLVARDVIDVPQKVWLGR